MNSFQVSIKSTTGLSYEVSNGVSTLNVAAGGPEPGSFLPSELFLAGLGTCMLATMMYSASMMKVDLTGATVSLMADSAFRPDRLDNIRVVYHLPGDLSEARKEALIRAGNRCKVHNTIASNPALEVSAT